MTIQGDTAFVTEDGVGIGRQISTKLADHGIMAVVADIDAEAHRETVNAAGGTVIETHLDLTDAASIVDTLKEARVIVGTIDILVNNAGVTGSRFDRPIEAWDETHFRSPFEGWSRISGRT